ncbi:MAG: alpha/beta hydrolase [Actinomycetia bacterium]|nr:alpha/beta hydrolase [Actinomycetes bacterium]
MTTIVVAHGAWSAGWAWKKMHPLLTGRGIRLVTPSYTGIGERTHLAQRGIDLDQHIEDLTQVFEYEDLSDIVLVAHSYGGMVGTGVLHRVPDRIREIIYLDAFVPESGQSLFDLVGTEAAARWRVAAAEQGDGWRLAANPLPPDTAPEDVEWIAPRRGAQPMGTFEQALTFKGTTDHRRSYIYCLRTGPTDPFGPFASRAKSNKAWRYREIDASHSPHITAPDAFADLLVELIAS